MSDSPARTSSSRKRSSAKARAPDETLALVPLHERRDYEHELLYSEVVEHLRAIAGAQGITQHTLATRLRVSDARVSRIMTGRENLTLKTLADLGWALGLRFEVVAVPMADRQGTPAAHDPPPPAWLRRHAQLVARRARDAMGANRSA